MPENQNSSTGTSYSSTPLKWGNVFWSIMYINKYKFCPCQNVDKFQNNVQSAGNIKDCSLSRGTLRGRKPKGQTILSIKWRIFQPNDYPW
jgi:hypothetical protein